LIPGGGCEPARARARDAAHARGRAGVHAVRVAEQRQGAQGAGQELQAAGHQGVPGGVRPPGAIGHFRLGRRHGSGVGSHSQGSIFVLCFIRTIIWSDFDLFTYV